MASKTKNDNDKDNHSDDDSNYDNNDVRRSGPTKRDGESLKEIELHHREWRREHHHKGCRRTSNLQKPENHKWKSKKQHAKNSNHML